MGEQHRLGPLQVGVARAGRRRRPRSARPSRTSWRADDLGGHAGQLPLGVQPQVGGDLVVAAATGVQLGPDVAGELGDPSLDGGVDVLVVGREGERALVQLLVHPVEGGEQDRRPPRRPAGRRARAPGHGPASRSGRRAARRRSKCEADGEVHDHVGGAVAEAAVPERHRGRLAGPPSPALLDADQVATPRPQSRTKPSASWWRKVSAGVVGGQAVVVEADRAAPAPTTQHRPAPRSAGGPHR